MRLNKRARRIVFGLGAVLLFSGSAAGAYALLSDRSDTAPGISATMGSVHTELLEEVPYGGENGAAVTANTKNFYALATGTKATIVRAKIVCTADHFVNGKYVAIPQLNNAAMEYKANGEPVATAPFTYKVKSAKNWVFNPEDGYWYYTKVLNPNGTGQNISHDSVTVASHPAGRTGTTEKIELEDLCVAGHNSKHPNDGDNEWAKYITVDTRLSVDVRLEAVQASNGAYLLVWGDVNNNIIKQIESGKVAADRDAAIEREKDLINTDERLLTKNHKTS